MGLVLGKSDCRVAFEREWAKYVPAVLQYGEKSRRKGIVSKMEDMVETGMSSIIEVMMYSCCQT